MFNKTNKPQQKQAASVPIPPLPDLPSSQGAKKPSGAKVGSVLASDLTFEGNITGSGELHIDGTVRGDVKVARLTVGETGNVEGSVFGDSIEIRGRVVGSVTGKQVRLMGTAYVDGDISHEQLSIDVGAYFQGRCLQSRKGEAPQAHHAPSGGGYATAPSYSGPAPDNGQLIELKPASA